MLGMTAVVEECLGSLLAGVNLRQRWGGWVRLTEMRTEATLSIVQCDHKRISFTRILRFSPGQPGSRHTILGRGWLSTGCSPLSLFISGT
jgi:hypothetical protein